MKIVPMKVEMLDSMGSDLTVANAARVSFSKESEWNIIGKGVDGYSVGDGKVLKEGDVKIINYLAKHNHWTPFGHTSLQFRIKAPIFVARQLVKHQVGLVWNEVSRRYVSDEPEFWFPEVWREKPEGSIKQGSGGAHEGSQDWNRAATTLTKRLLEFYNDMILDGVAPEQARMILPQNTMTEWWWTGSLAAFARVCKLRLDPHAQAETREVAEQINALAAPLFPVAWAALMEN